MTTSTTYPIALALALLPACALQIDKLTVAQDDTSDSAPPDTDPTDGDATESGDTVVTLGVDDSGPSTTQSPDETSSGTTGGTPDDTTAGPPDDTTAGPTPGDHDVDILFVIDNSGSMAGVQQSIAAGIAPMVQALDAADVDYRIAVTTTDSGNPRCPSATTKPEAGKMVPTSCRARVPEGEFEFAGEDFSAACLEQCAHAQIAISGTATHEDPNLAPRPWLERMDGVTNVDVPMAEAAACVLPQGVAGCGFEQPLESMYRALARMSTPGEPEFGFLRPQANLLIVIVTDEMDCSYNPEHDEIFVTNKEFWNDPSDPAPTSAMCWRAGMQCLGGPGEYDSCEPAAFSPDGSLAADEDDGVLRPVSLYREFLAALGDAKAQAGGGKVFLAAIAGVPSGYQLGDALVYADATDPDIQANFGIGPGCVSGEGDSLKIAVPPGRIEPLVTMTPGVSPLGEGLYSICDQSLSALPGVFGDLLLQ